MATTASSTTAQDILGQPPFATQLRYPAIKPLGQGPDLQKGYMIWDYPGTSAADAASGTGLNYSGGTGLSGRAMVNFLFNPSEIDFSAQVGDQTAQVLQAYKYAGSTVVNAMSQPQTASWSLYYDRTYELWNGASTGSQWDASVIGVQADVLAFYQFTGMLSQAQIDSGNQAVASTLPLGMMIAPMTMIYSWVYFGTSSGGTAGGTNTSALASQLAYYGYISAFSVEYTAFNRNMVPRQCEIDVTFTVVSPLTESTASSSAYGSGVLSSTGGGQINYGN